MRAALGLFVTCLLAACAPALAPERQEGVPVYLSRALPLEGVASWYGPGFIGRLTANGEVYTARELTAAHRALPFGTHLKVTNLHNGRSVVVRVNDRGPFIGQRVIDLSEAAAERLDMIHSGLAQVRLEYVSGPDPGAILLARPAPRLSGFDVALRHHREGDLLLVTSRQRPNPVLARVVSVEVPADADILLSSEAYELLGDAVRIASAR